MAFPRPFNALAKYWNAPPWCPGAVALASNIPIRQLKDYLPYYPAEADKFFSRPMVRWCMDPAASPFSDPAFPSTTDPESGFLTVHGQVFSEGAYQLVGAENIMLADPPGTVDYLYLLLRQVTPADVTCPFAPTTGGATFTSATELGLTAGYITTLAPGSAPSYFHYAQAVVGTPLILEINTAAPTEWGVAAIYESVSGSYTLMQAFYANGSHPYTPANPGGAWIVFQAPAGTSMAPGWSLTPV